MNATDRDYVLGHSERELARLKRQADLFAGMTRDILARAGIRPGMRVLDLGCGVGDVSAIAGELVGPSGFVLGIDSSPEAIAAAKQRMRDNGSNRIAFAQKRIEDCEQVEEFDAIVGRFILIHISQPAEFMQRLVGNCRAGTILAFAELDISTAVAQPPLLLLDNCIRLIVETYRRAGRQADMGAQLYPTFRAAGLEPRMMGFTRIADGSDRVGIAFLIESLKSLLPAMEALGVARAEEVAIDTLGSRLAAEATSGDHCMFYPRLIGAWAEVG